MNTSPAALAADLRAAADFADQGNWTQLRTDAANEVSDHGYAASLDLAHVLDVLADVDPDEGGTLAEFVTACHKAAGLLDAVA